MTDTPITTETENQLAALMALHPSAFLTGTRAYGPVTRDSDWDICFLNEARTESYEDRILATLPDPLITRSDYFNNSIYATTKRGMGTRFNLIFLGHVDYVCWRRATEMLRTLDPFHTPNYRYAAFEMARAIVRMSLPGVLTRGDVQKIYNIGAEVPNSNGGN
jgi:hypothetical protein